MCVFFFGLRTWIENNLNQKQFEYTQRVERTRWKPIRTTTLKRAYVLKNKVIERILIVLAKRAHYICARNKDRKKYDCNYNYCFWFGLERDNVKMHIKAAAATTTKTISKSSSISVISTCCRKMIVRSLSYAATIISHVARIHRIIMECILKWAKRFSHMVDYDPWNR